MAKHGFVAWWPYQLLAVHGFSWELVRRYRKIVGVRRQLRDRLLADRPSLFIGVDAPDFNLALESSLRQEGIRTVHFVCPSVWAWRAERLKSIRQSVDHMLCIFPFEPELLARHGIPATFVGHPLASVIPLQPDKAAARAALGLGSDDQVVALLPGSREAEITHLAGRFFESAKYIAAARPGVKFVVPAAPGLKDRLDSIASQVGMHDQLQVVQGQSHTVLAACDVTLIASGTATLEAALFKRPMVIGYHMGWLSWQLMKRKRLLPWAGLPNILCREFVVPELLQEAATPQALAKAVLDWLDAMNTSPQRIADLEQKFTELHLELRRDTATITLNAIQEVLRR